MIDLFAGFDEEVELDYTPEIIKAPFAYVGGKTKSMKHITPMLPQRSIYIEPFGGSGVILLNRRPSKLEVFNDRYSGVVDFYRVLQDHDLMNQMIDILELQIHSREMFAINKKEWVTETDPVTRAAKWYAMARYSFSGKMRAWGRSLNAATTSMSHKIYKKLPELHGIHERIKHVQFENRNALTMLKEYDSPDTVFYLDPPYINSCDSSYIHSFTHDDHRDLLQMIFDMEGFVAISGYTNPLYEDQPWDDRIEWEVQTMVAGNNNEGGNQCAKGIKNNNLVKEVLWIKE